MRIFREHRKSDRAGNIDLAAGGLHRSEYIFSCLFKAFEHDRGVVRMDFGQNRKFVAAPAGDREDVGQLGQSLPDGLQHMVADRVAISVIDLFESVDVGDGKAKPLALGLMVLQRIDQGMFEAEPVFQSRRRIGLRHGHRHLLLHFGQRQAVFKFQRAARRTFAQSLQLNVGFLDFGLVIHLGRVQRFCRGDGGEDNGDKSYRSVRKLEWHLARQGKDIRTDLFLVDALLAGKDPVVLGPENLDLVRGEEVAIILAQIVLVGHQPVEGLVAVNPLVLGVFDKHRVGQHIEDLLQLIEILHVPSPGNAPNTQARVSRLRKPVGDARRLKAIMSVYYTAQYN